MGGSDKNSPIGIFDSGIGGLTVFKAVRDALPNEELVYLGDTARVPYGTKSAETIVRYSLENARFLCDRSVKMIVVACNTSSAYALPAIAEQNGTPVIGVIEPGARAAIAASKNGRIGVIGTASTIASGSYAKELKRLKTDVKVVSMACSLFVPLVEEGWVDNDVARKVAEEYLSAMKKEKIDTLILGCTHYPLLKKVIHEVMGDSVALVDSAATVALELKEKLSAKDMLRDSSKKPVHNIYVTDLPGRFEMTASRFLAGEMPSVKVVEL